MGSGVMFAAWKASTLVIRIKVTSASSDLI
jgi:hypothetical protein